MKNGFILSTYSLLLAGLLLACGQGKKSENTATTDTQATTEQTATPISPDLPPPSESSTHFSNVVGWKDGQMPKAPDGFVVTEFARDLDNPRRTYVLPNGDVLVVESQTERKGVVKKVVAAVSGQAKSGASGKSANRITLLRDANKDGKPEVRETFLEGLNQPFGVLVIGNTLYVANTDGLLKFPYQTGQTKITAKGTSILPLPAGGYNNHWTRNLLANADGSKIYVSVGSGSNVGEHGMENEVKRANILEINPDGSGERIYASGLRNPVGMDWAPGTKTLWTAVNERDELGDELVPDYITSVKEGGFYGWPYSYFGQHEDQRRKGERPDLVQKAIVPDVPVGSHTASLGLAFYDKTAFPEKYRNGAFVGQHGSWNRSSFAGYKVIFVPFQNGKPSGKPEDFLTGFIENDNDVFGRPVGLSVLPDGSLLVADDAGNRIWRVSAK
ncbi:PQQ-dependent sugar dehydrogenase [Larkinella terrae]|uniref:Sorbosone dehydrogenase family protein n=1 Tax=Larkinella terrae TaxID=2025311 RepID=A0A7K0EK78_9BACT|nr:sorbosone dehydrogenase family protein [Larkinella terrae]MRS61931.1 sorbosone dehydrogenase family protein [Larkinella terrae]